MAEQHAHEDEAPAPGVSSIDTDNLLALVAAVHQLRGVGAIGSAAERSTMVQALGAQVEQHAEQLIRESRVARGYSPEPARVVALPTPAVTPASAAPAPAGPGPLTGERARRIMERLSTFTMSELISELNCSRPTAKKFLDAALSAKPPVVKSAGKLGRTPLFEWCAPPRPNTDPTSRPKGPDPARMAGANTESPARGMPIRVAASAKLTRRGRSTPGVRHQALMRDRRYEQMEAAKEARAREQRGKAHRAANQASGGKGKKKSAEDRVRNEAKRIEAEARARVQGDNL